ncbi:hypothetical protein [Microbacterium sp. EST19A]|uniref:hypothetical protein n=1 Tax=Microbacterium sp. EST19A TaxID=2862681 RepID=UPI001CC05F90|nr:hypothetical protein [Microbacterium sp. EST19A]
MSLGARRTLLWVLAAFGLLVGPWALLFPAHWYETFPDGFANAGLDQWILLDGPFNEHMIRDIGAMNLALAAASIFAALSRSTTAARVAAVAWITFSAPHLIYHVQHLHGLSTLDTIVEPISLTFTLLLPIPLLLPSRSSRRDPAEPERN